MIERVIQLHSKELGFALGIPKVYQVQGTRIEAIFIVERSEYRWNTLATIIYGYRLNLASAQPGKLCPILR